MSMNSTTRSNLTVGRPIDLLIYEKDSLGFGRLMTIGDNDEFAKKLTDSWDAALVRAIDNLPRFPWEG